MQAMFVADPDLVTPKHGDAVEAASGHGGDAFRLAQVPARVDAFADTNHGLEACERIDLRAREPGGLEVAAGGQVAQGAQG